MKKINIKEYEKIKENLRQLGFEKFNLEKIKKGLNSEIYKISNDENNLILKFIQKSIT